MINQKSDTKNVFGTILFIVLFVFFISYFSDKSEKQTSGSFQIELATELHSNNSSAVIVDNTPTFSYQNICLSILYNSNLNLSDQHLKIFSDNRKSFQTFVEQQYLRLKIKPIVFCRFYICIHSSDTEDLPILS